MAAAQPAELDGPQRLEGRLGMLMFSSQARLAHQALPLHLLDDLAGLRAAASISPQPLSTCEKAIAGMPKR